MLQEADTPDARAQAGAALLEQGVQQVQTPKMWAVYGAHLYAAMSALQDTSEEQQVRCHLSSC